MTSEAGTRNYRPDIDGLRAVAILAVIAFHAAAEVLPGGYLGVDVFFVISGFLITCNLLRWLEEGSLSIPEFYRRRVRRIFPALVLTLAACLAFGWFAMTQSEYALLGKHASGGAFFVSNYLFAGEGEYFDLSSIEKPLLHLWSLSVEEQFYILWPFVLLLLHRFEISKIRSISILMVISLAWHVHSQWVDPVGSFFSTAGRAWELLAGALLACQRNRDHPRWRSVDRQGGLGVLRAFSLQGALGAVGMGLIVTALFTGPDGRLGPIVLRCMVVLGTAIAIHVGPSSVVIRWGLSNPVAVWIGLLSYPLYLWHWPVLSFMELQGYAGTPGEKAVAITTAAALAVITYVMVERPIRFTEKGMRAAPVMFALVVLLGAAGYWLDLLGGVPARQFAVATAKIDEARRDVGYGTTSMVDGQIEGAIFLQGVVNEKVLFIGDSVMGMYFPRLDLIYRETPPPYFSTLFVARNHCQPVPGFDIITSPEGVSCEDYYRAAMALAEEPDIPKVVLTGNWINLAPEGSLSDQGSRLATDLQRLRALGKEIYLILPHPVGWPFGPKLHLQAIRKGFWRAPSDSSISRAVVEEWTEPSRQGVELVARDAGSLTIDPYDYFCDGADCPTLVEGEPLYIDCSHMRAKWVRKRALFLDAVVDSPLRPAVPAQPLRY
jgi:peptidoglycan/LPS O-acetylase OafA/YrhL